MHQNLRAKEKYEPLISSDMTDHMERINEGVRTIEVDDVRSPSVRKSRADVTSFINTTPRVKGPTVTSFQHTSMEDEVS